MVVALLAAMCTGWRLVACMMLTLMEAVLAAVVTLVEVVSA